MNRKYTYEILAPICAESKSYREVVTKLGLSNKSGGNIANIKARIKEFNINISHFTGQSWNKENYDYSWMKKNHPYRSNYRFSLIKLRGHKCECCGLTEWNNQPIPLEVHHCDKDKTNNEPNNLKLYCPNCHYFTDGYRNRNIDG